MGKIHRRYSPTLKAKIAMEAIREEETVAENEVHPRFQTLLK